MLPAGLPPKASRQSQLLEYQGRPHGLLVTHQQQLSADLVRFLCS
jgi:hypothetical protein